MILKTFFKSDGRIARLPFFAYTVMITIGIIALVFLGLALLDTNTAGIVVGVGLILGSVIAAAWANIVLVMKRLKDMNYSPYLVIPLMACNFFSGFAEKTAPQLSLALSLGVIIAYLFLFFVPGTKGDNQYGEQPN